LADATSENPVASQQQVESGALLARFKFVPATVNQRAHSRPFALEFDLMLFARQFCRQFHISFITSSVGRRSNQKDGVDARTRIPPRALSSG
jgi:hypothetical protein